MKKNRLVVQILVMVFTVSCLGIAGAQNSVMTVFPKGMVKVTDTKWPGGPAYDGFPAEEWLYHGMQRTVRCPGMELPASPARIRPGFHWTMWMVNGFVTSIPAR